MDEPPTVTVEQCVQLVKQTTWTRREVISRLRWLFTTTNNFETFCRFFFSEAFNKPFAPFHHEIINEFQNPRNTAVAAPRGHGKSTLVGLGDVMWDITHHKEKYIVYMSQNHRKSTGFIDPVRRHCKNNKLLRYVYPELEQLRSVHDETGKDREDCFDVNNTRIEAVSYEKDIRGLRYGTTRPTKIILDDIETKERVINPELRVKDLQKLNADVIPALDPEQGKIKFIGTILHQESILRNKLRVYNGKIYKAITNGHILWPELYPQRKLDEIKHDVGALVFAQEYLNEPADSGISIFRRAWMDAAKDTELSCFELPRTKYELKVQGVDFAFSDRLLADSSAFGTLCKRYNEEAETHYDTTQLIWKQGMSVTEQLDFIEYLSGTYGYDDNALEENSIRSMSKELRRYRFPFTLFWTAGSDPRADKPRVEEEHELKRHVVGKTGLITRLATAFENNRIHLPYKTETDQVLTDRFIEECLTFALDDGKLVETGTHADMPVAIAYALERSEMERFHVAVTTISIGNEEEEETYDDD